MLGPVYFREWRNASCRARHHVFRSAYTLVLCLEFGFFLYLWLGRFVLAAALHAGAEPAAAPTPAGVWAFFPLFALQQLIFLVLMAPALAAGSIADEKTRGTLADL